MAFVDRVDAGRRLAARLEYLESENPVVLGLPRGGVPVAFEVARALGAPLDVIVVRKLGVPFQPELGMGAIGEGGVRIVNEDVLRVTRVSREELAVVEERERAELERRVQRLRGGRARVPLEGRTVVVVDDGIATGSTARAACQVARAQGAGRVVLAVPVAPWDWAARVRHDADETIGLHTPEQFYAIGEFYADFSQVSDGEVVEYLRARRCRAGSPDGDQLGQPGRRPPGPARGGRADLRAGPAGRASDPARGSHGRGRVRPRQRQQPPQPPQPARGGGAQ